MDNPSPTTPSSTQISHLMRNLRSVASERKYVMAKKRLVWKLKVMKKKCLEELRLNLKDIAEEENIR